MFSIFSIILQSKARYCQKVVSSLEEGVLSPVANNFQWMIFCCQKYHIMSSTLLLYGLCHDMSVRFPVISGYKANRKNALLSYNSQNSLFGGYRLTDIGD